MVEFRRRLLLKTMELRDRRPKKACTNTPEFLKIISAKLSDAIGPIAPLVLRERIVALGESAETFNEAKIGELNHPSEHRDFR